jgi:hypothetical protein
MKKIIRIIGAILVSIVAAYCLVLVIVFSLGYADVPFNLETIGVLVLSVLTIVGAVMTWVRMRIGVWIVLVVGLLFTIFALISTEPYSLSSQIFAVMVSGGLLIVGGLLMLWGLKEE